MISRSVCIEKFTFNICFIEKRSDSLSLDSDELAESVKRINARVLVLDPIQSFLGENIDMNRANVIRPRLNHLKELAEKTGCAVLLVGHLNKNSSGKANYRGLGSIFLRPPEVFLLSDDQRITLKYASSLSRRIISVP